MMEIEITPPPDIAKWRTKINVSSERAPNNHNGAHSRNHNGNHCGNHNGNRPLSVLSVSEADKLYPIEIEYEYDTDEHNEGRRVSGTYTDSLTL